jgi:hypothetical protein
MGPPCSDVLGGGNKSSQGARKGTPRCDGGIAMEARAKVSFLRRPKKTRVVDHGFCTSTHVLVRRVSRYINSEHDRLS